MPNIVPNIMPNIMSTIRYQKERTAKVTMGKDYMREEESRK